MEPTRLPRLRPFPPPFSWRPRERPPRERYGLHALLFVLTLASTTYAGALLVGRLELYLREAPFFVLGGLPVTATLLLDGLRFGGALLLFLTVHEFGHYFAARRHGIDVSLPYYIPFPFNGIGTFGAVIRIREPIPSPRKLFDVGAAGPLAGFVVALGLLLYALATLPPPSYLFDQPGHEALKAFIEAHGRFPREMLEEPGADGTMTILIGQTPLFWLLSQLFPHVPPMYEMYHYPLLFAGWLGLFFTALNLLPIGQLDGGHVLYTLVGPRWHARLARGFVLLLLLSGGIGLMADPAAVLGAWGGWAEPLAWVGLAALLYAFLSRIFHGDHRRVAPALLALMVLTALAVVVGPAATQYGYVGWLLFGALVVFLIRVDHPPVLYHEPLTPARRWLGYLCLLIFVLCFSIKPIYVAG